MDYKVVSARNNDELTHKVKTLIAEEWEPIGSHHVVETHRQNRYAGSQHMDTTIKVEYSQTMIKK